MIRASLDEAAARGLLRDDLSYRLTSGRLDLSAAGLKDAIREPVRVRCLRGEREETPKPGSEAFENVENRVIATARRSLEAAANPACRPFRDMLVFCMMVLLVLVFGFSAGLKRNQGNATAPVVRAFAPLR